MSLVALIALSNAAFSADDLQATELGDAPDRGEEVTPGGLDREATQEIINGENAGTEEWPTTYGLIVGADVDYYGMTFSDTALMCTATLIAPDVIMTAGHCTDIETFFALSGYDMELNKIRFGFSRKHDLTDYNLDFIDTGWPDDIDTDQDGEPDIAIGKHDVRPDGFNLLTMQVGLAKNDDISLVFLDEPMLDAPLAYLPTPEEAELIVEGAPVTIVGWGQQTSDSYPPPGTVGIKKQAETVIGEVGAPEFQVGPDKDDGRKCHGDSGGPTFLEVDSDTTTKLRVIGVTSHSYDYTDCASKGGVDTRVDYHLEWIDAQMRQACADGTRSWCDDEQGILPPPSTKISQAFARSFLYGGEPMGGCDHAGGSSSWLLAGLALLGLRRRS